MTKLHQFHQIEENIRFTTEDLEALHIDEERFAERRGRWKWRLGTRPPSISRQKKTTTETIDSPSWRLLYICFNMGILGLEKSQKRHPNSFKTRQIAIKPHELTPIILLSSLSSPSPPPLPPKKEKHRQKQKVLDSRTLQRSYFVTHYWKVNKHKHTAGKTFKRSSKDFISLFGKSLESLLPGKGRWHPSLPARVHFQIVVDSQTSLWIRDRQKKKKKSPDRGLVSLKDRCKSTLNSYLYKTGSLLYKQLCESWEWPSEVWSSYNWLWLHQF